MTTKEDIISNIYHDLESGWDSSITLDDVKTWMKRHPNKQRRPYKNSNSYTAPFARFEYQADRMDMGILQKAI